MATLKLVVRKGATLKNGNYPISLRLSHRKQSQTYIRLYGLEVQGLDEFNESLCRFTRKKPNYKLLNQELTKIENRADEILTLLLLQNRFSYDTFREMYNGTDKVSNSVVDAFNNKITALRKEGKESTAIYYNSCKVALLETTKGKKILFNDINYSFLKSFENYFLSKGVKSNTIAVYLRGLRSIVYEYYKTINKPKPNYFVEFKLQRLQKPTAKRALSKTEIKKLINYKTESYNERRTVDLFLFSFYANGMNLKDILNLTAANIINNRIEYTRSKTKGIFSIRINEPMQSIIDRYSNESIYIFPINHKGFTHVKYKTFLHNFNRTLKRIAAQIEINNNITIYFARHTFAQLARNNDVSIDIISQLLGHKSVETTKTYLSSFSNDKLDSTTQSIFNSL